MPNIQVFANNIMSLTNVTGQSEQQIVDTIPPGESLNVSFTKINDNFSNVWLAGPVNSNIQIANNAISTTDTNGNLVLNPNGIGNVVANAHVVPDQANVRNLGSSSLRWNTVYTQYATVYNDLDVAGNLTVQGNIIQIGNIVTDSLTIQLANTATTANAANGSGITVGANDNLATLLYNSTGNTWTTNIGISSVGNITAPYFIGNGSQLTGIVSSYGNANVAAYLPTYSGNIAGGNIGVSGAVNAVGEITSFANLVTIGEVQATGNVVGNYFVGNGSQLTGISVASTGNLDIFGTTISIAAGAPETYINMSPTIEGWAFLQLPKDDAANTYNTRLWNGAGNVEIGAGDFSNSGPSYTWTLDNTGNLNLPTNGDVNFDGGNIYQAQNEDFYIILQDQDDDGWGLYNRVNDGDGTTLAQTRLQRDQFSITTDYNNDGYQWSFDNFGRLNLPGNIQGAYSANTSLYAINTGVDGGLVELKLVSFAGDALISNVTVSNPNVTISTAGSAYTWTFDSTGNLNTPQGGWIGAAGVKGDGTMLTGGTGQLASLTSFYADAPGIYAGCFTANPDGTLNITTYGNGTGVAGQWTFTDANLTLPVDGNLVGTTANNNGFISWVGNSSGDSLGYTIMGLIPDETLVNSDQYIILDPTAPGHIHIRPGGTQDNSGADLFLGGENSYFRVNSGANSSVEASANNYSWTFGTDGTFTLPGDANNNQYSEITSVGNSSGDGYGYATLQLKPDASISGDSYLIIDPTAPNHIHIRAGGAQDNSGAQLFLGGENSYFLVENGANSNVYVASNSNQWKFDTNGVATLPGEGILQSIDDTVTLQSLNTLTGNANSVYLGTSGGLGFNDQEIGGNWLEIFRNGAEPEIRVPVGRGNLTIQTASGNTPYNWTFDDTGNLTAPGNVTATGNITGGNLISTTGVYANVDFVVGNRANASATKTRFVADSGFSYIQTGNGTAGTTGNIVFSPYSDPTQRVVINTSTGNLTAVGNISGGNINTAGNITGNTAGFAIGYRDIPQVSFTGNATIATTDAGKHFYSTQSSNFTLTIANNASQGFQVGAAITVVNQGSGTITIAQGSGVTLYLAGNVTSGNRTVATFGMATLIKVATDTWFINGTGVS